MIIFEWNETLCPAKWIEDVLRGRVKFADPADANKKELVLGEETFTKILEIARGKLEKVYTAVEAKNLKSMSIQEQKTTSWVDTEDHSRPMPCWCPLCFY